MSKEPVLIAAAVQAVVALGFAIQSGHVTEGLVVTAVLAVVALFVRSKVSPTGSGQ